jgi:hypothetical protein
MVHQMLQDAMGWDHMHMHMDSFGTDEHTIIDPRSGSGIDPRSGFLHLVGFLDPDRPLWTTQRRIRRQWVGRRPGMRYQV